MRTPHYWKIRKRQKIARWDKNLSYALTGIVILMVVGLAIVHVSAAALSH